MANPFGELIDNDKLNEIGYVYRPKTQEDRAREALRLINEADKNTKAVQYVESVRNFYGSGITTMCVIYNATGDDLYYVADHDWWGLIGRTPYPTKIGNGQWVAFHHVQKTGEASGSVGAVVYRGKNKYGRSCDIMLAWSSPFGIWYRNKAYCQMGPVNFIRGRWDEEYEKLINGDYSHSVESDGIKVEVDTATGANPLFRAIIKIP